MNLSFSVSQQNMKKNRYRDILAYDDTRVVLANPSADYINANFVTFPNGRNPLHFICSQGPLPTTVDNHW